MSIEAENTTQENQKVDLQELILIELKVISLILGEMQGIDPNEIRKDIQNET